jgi:hypothetical protein
MNVVYKLTINGKFYIGKTKKGLDHRLKQHISNAINRRGKSPYLENAINKYGVESVNSTVLVTCETEEELAPLEIKFIAELNTLCPNGYNLSAGGDGNSFKHSEEFKLQKSIAMRKNHCDKGLEMYVKYTKTPNGSEGYIVTRPGCKSAQFCSPDLTMEEKLTLANGYAKALADGTAILENRYRQIDFGYENIPVGICYLSKFDGFRVTPPGKQVRWFKSQKLTRDEKYRLALKYYYE